MLVLLRATTAIFDARTRTIKVKCCGLFARRFASMLLYIFFFLFIVFLFLPDHRRCTFVDGNTMGSLHLAWPSIPSWLLYEHLKTEKDGDVWPIVSWISQRLCKSRSTLVTYANSRYARIFSRFAGLIAVEVGFSPYPMFARIFFILLYGFMSV